MSRIRNKKAALAIAVVLLCFLASLVPIFYVSFFNHPTADDYGYSDLVHSALLGGGGIFGAMTIAVYGAW